MHAVLTEIAGSRRSSTMGPDDGRLGADGEADPADSVYFGGGTPSLLSLDRLGRLLAELGARFAIERAAEVTIEANPRDLDTQACRSLREIGINRLSLGVQSFDDEILREMGRTHDARDVVRSVEAARNGGIPSLNLDLILGWPGETRERWARTLDQTLWTAPDHVSLYLLEVEGKNLIAHRARRGTLVLPEDDLVAALYLETVERLEAAGLERYEISNFARAGHASRHNAKYWDDAPFLGFGPSAHSFRDGVRFWNLATFAGYCRAIEQNGAGGAIEAERRLTPRERVGEALFTGLRRSGGVDLAAFRERYDVDVLAEYGPALHDAFQAGLIETAGTTLRLTDGGVLLANEVFRAFV